MKCPRCGNDNIEYTEGYYKAEVIQPHGYVAPVHYNRCKNCGAIFKDTEEKPQ